MSFFYVGSCSSTLAAFQAVKEGREFMYDPGDHELVKRFLRRIKLIKNKRNLTLLKQMEAKLNPSSPYLPLCRGWRFADGEGDFFLDVMQNELKLMDNALASILSEVMHTLQIHVTADKVYCEGKKVLGIDGTLDMITDGLRHGFSNSPLLFEYLESPSMSYVAKQRMDVAGNWW